MVNDSLLHGLTVKFELKMFQHSYIVQGAFIGRVNLKLSSIFPKVIFCPKKEKNKFEKVWLGKTPP